MGSKDKGRKESKKPPKPKAKAAPNVHTPVRKVENFSHRCTARQGNHRIQLGNLPVDITA